LPDDQSIEREPHVQGRMPRLDPSEAKAERTLAREERYADRPPDSIYDEPAIFPGQGGQPIDQDWSCSQCGYNLRGLTTGHPCPECGHVEVYHPPPKEARESYGQWLVRHRADVSPWRSWRAVAIASLIGGPLAIFGAFMNAPEGGWFLLIVFGPAVEEAMKVAAISWIVEVRPYLIRDRRQILFPALMSALAFAAIENVLYLKIYIRSPEASIIMWRWLGCTSLHVTCSLVASMGLVQVWRRTVDEGRRPQLSLAWRFLVAAIALHGLYNAAVTGLEISGVLF
jgi:hypothetical protein